MPCEVKNHLSAILILKKPSVRKAIYNKGCRRVVRINEEESYIRYTEAYGQGFLRISFDHTNICRSSQAIRSVV